MKLHIAIGALLVLLSGPGAAHDRGEPAEFPRWRGAPELTVYFPPPPRIESAPAVAPAAARPDPDRIVPPRRSC